MSLDPFVQEAQRRLIAHGYPLPKFGADGFDGTETREALEDFQEKHGLPESGMLDSATVSILFGDDGSNESLPVDRDADEPEEPVPSAVQNIWPRQRDMLAFYGEVGKNQTRLTLPFPMRLAWKLETVVKRITVHEKVHDSAARCFGRIANEYSEAARRDLGIDLYGGSLNVRKMRGGSRWSMHSWGIAIDFDPSRNQLRWKAPRPRLSKPDAEPFWRIWEEEGWVSLGRARDYDWMHIQAARL